MAHRANPGPMLIKGEDMANNDQSGWTQTPAPELVKGTPEWIAERDRQLAAWEASKIALEAAKAAEMEARKAFVKFAFNHEKLEGTERIPLHNGYEAKAVKKLNYNLVSHTEGVSTVDAVDAALTRIEAVSDEGKFIAERLVKWTASLSISEYRKLDETPNGQKFKAIIDEVVETSEGAPTLEIVPPKGQR